jgi:HD-GYP domain-containing protein (c-di-GMP phosphodiesterase class II)
MKSISLSELVPSEYFDHPVYLDQTYILLTPDSPVTPELLKRLQKWKFQEVFTEGATKDVPGYLSGSKQSGVAPQTIDEDIHETRQLAAAQKFYNELTNFATVLFVKYVADGVLNLADVTDWVKKAMQMVHDNRDYLLRFLEVGADSERYLITHSVNTTILALAVGDYMKTPPHRLIELGNACLLHEIGMYKLPPELRHSSKVLSPEERKLLSAHTILGYRVLKGFSAPENVALAALEHHERIDGSGYPRKLTAPKITDYALIIGVACSYDAMMSKRPFRPGTLDGHATIRDLAQKNKKQYDEKILKALVYTLSVYPVGTGVQLSNNSKGIVLRTDPAKPRCPIVKVIFDPDGKKLAESPLIQVSENQGLSITGVLSADEAKLIKGMA